MSAVDSPHKWKPDSVKQTMQVQRSATAIKWRGGPATRSCVHNEIGPRLRNTTRVSRNATDVARLAARAIEVRKAVVKRRSYGDRSNSNKMPKSSKTIRATKNRPVCLVDKYLNSVNPCSIYTMHISWIMQTDVPEPNDEIYLSTAVSSHSQQLKVYKYYCLC